jgi:hypothetical protein
MAPPCFIDFSPPRHYALLRFAAAAIFRH